MPANLRFLRLLVTVLTVTMIGGVLAIVTLLVIRLSGDAPPQPGLAPLPEAITLPDDARATAFTQGGDWFAVVTGDDRILIYDRVSVRLRQTVEIAR